MTDISQAFVTALQLLLTFDENLVQIVGLSLQVSLSAVGLAVLIGLPLGAALALFKFPGRDVLVGREPPK